MSTKQVICMRNDLGMRKGKMISQGSHASSAWLTTRALNGGSPAFTPAQWEWLGGNHRKICVQVDSEAKLTQIYEQALAMGLEAHLVTDAGLTEFHGVPTLTCLALGPDIDERIDVLTAGLKLY